MITGPSGCVKMTKICDSNWPSAHGGKRTGAGRPHLDGSPPGQGERASQYSVTLPADVAEYLRTIGEGNLSAGVRVAAELHKEWTE